MSGRRKVTTLSKETENGTVINMLTSNQDDQSQDERPSNPPRDSTPKDTGGGEQDNLKPNPNDQRDSEKSKSLGPTQVQGDLSSARDSGKNQALTSQEETAKAKNLENRTENAIGDKTDNRTLDKSKQSNDLGNQGKELVNPNYLAILGNKPPNDNTGLTITVNSDSEGENAPIINLNDKDAVFLKAMEFSRAGNLKETSKYLEIYKSLVKNQMNRSISQRAVSSNEISADMNLARPTNHRSTSMNPEMELGEKTIPEGAVFENGMWFLPGLTSDHNTRSYTPYFDKNIQELRYPIPLTIFDKEWQSRAMTCHIKKRPRSYENDPKTDSPYNGLPYADEWLLDYGEWCIYYDTFISVLATKFTKFTEWVKAHKLNVAKVLASKGWMTALKYDMRVRENALVNRVKINGKVAPPDISQYDHMLVEECFDESRMRGELNFRKNPYVEGGEREGWDPATGSPPKKNFEKNTQMKGKTFQKWNNNQREENQVASTSGPYMREKKKFRRGYQGNNYDENYAEKKAAANAAKEGIGNK
ncbi:hypothetical protein DFH28DRAFT_1195392 [Melampsora americana]|nr:hypothetical protein DFH28DRAFT_1195392 [Melampsora americana]